MFKKYAHLNKLMLTFTHNETDKYFKLLIMNEIKNYITKLISNTKSDNIKFFSNIELGSNYDNPHLHVQLFYDDYNQIMKIRDKVISKYELNGDYCDVTIPERADVVYKYVVKDYDNNLSDDTLLLLDSVKRDYRRVLGSSIRFSSMSKDKYAKAIYKKAYAKGIRKEYVNDLIDSSIINKEIEIVDNRVIMMVILRVLIQYRINKINAFFDGEFEIKSQIPYKDSLSLWIFGFY